MRPELHDDQLVVYDRKVGRIAYQVEVESRPRINGIDSVAVQLDGKVAAVLTREGGRCYVPQLVWSSPAEAPRLHVLRYRPDVGSSSDVDLVGDKLLFARAALPRCSPYVGFELVVAPLDSSSSRLRVLGRYGSRARRPVYLGPSFDFDVARAVFSEGTRAGTSIFVDRVR